MEFISSYNVDDALVVVMGPYRLDRREKDGADVDVDVDAGADADVVVVEGELDMSIWPLLLSDS